MAILFEQVEGWFRPRFVCDACQQPITDVDNAMVAYEEPREDDSATLTRALHGHKADRCQELIRRAAGHEDWNGMWDELANHIVMLAVGVGMFPADFADQYDYLLQTDRVPAPPSDDAEDGSGE